MTDYPIKRRIVEKRRIFRALGRIGGFTPLARKAQAIFLAATPDERWTMHDNFLRSIRLFSFEQRKSAGLGETHEAQKAAWPVEQVALKFKRYLAARHGFEP